jgi:molybdenum cofactor cytidylyltransferase
MVPGVILAGGASSRMGRPKALLQIRDRTFLESIVGTLRAGGVDDVLVVTGSHDLEIRECLAASADRLGDVRVAQNPIPDRGQLSSILAALAAVDRPGVGAMLVTLVDLPLVRADTVAALIATWRASRAPVVRPRFGDRHGHPVIFDRAVFDALRAAPPDRGARALVHALGASVLDVPTLDEGVCIDIDTPDDYRRLLDSLRIQDQPNADRP